MKKLRLLFKTLFLGLTLAVGTIGLTSCASAEEKGTSTYFNCVSCVYNSKEDTTKVVWSSILTNDSIYDMTEEHFKFDLFQGDTFIRTTDFCRYTIKINHGKFDSGLRNFTVSGSVTRVELNSWTAKFASLWDTYIVWFIVTIVIAALVIVGYGIFVFIEDIELLEDRKAHV